MKRGFSLIELIVSVVIISLVSGGALVYLNKFNSRQKLEKGKDEVVAAIKMIQSSAKGRQLPNGSTLSELIFIQLYSPIIGGVRYLKADANNVGDQIYYRKSVTELGVDVNTDQPFIYFWAGSGRLAKNGTDDFYGENETAKITVTHSAEINERYEIIINAMGQIKEVNYYEN